MRTCHSRGLGVAIVGALALAGCGEDAGVVVRSAKEVAVLEQSSLIAGRDGGASGLLWGRSVWAYGDTVLTAEDEVGSSWHHNSFSFTSDLDASDGITGFAERPDATGAPLHLVAPTAEEEAFNAAHRGDPCAETPCGARWAAWPGRPVFDEERNRAIIPYGLVYAEPGAWNFHGVGQSFALWSDFEALPERPIADPAAEHPTLVFHEGEPGYGIAPVIADGALHVFACEGNDKACTLARAPLDRLLERAAWQYWDGGGWSSDMGQAEALFDGAPIMVVDHNPHLGRWTAIYSQPLVNEVVIRTAPALTGPWSDATTLFTADRKTSEGWVYDAAVHPEYSQDNGRILQVSFSRPTGQGWFGAEIALVQVELE